MPSGSVRAESEHFKTEDRDDDHQQTLQNVNVIPNNGEAFTKMIQVLSNIDATLKTMKLKNL